MTARPDEVMAIPVDADSRIGEAFVTTIQRDVLIDLILVFFRVGLGAVHGRLFLNGKDENQIALCLDPRFV